MTTTTDKKPAPTNHPWRPAHPANGTDAAKLWEPIWDWLSRPTHYRAVRNLRFAVENGDSLALRRLLDPKVALVIEAGESQHLDRRVVVGSYDAIALLMHGLGSRDGLSIDVRSVNGQAGIMLTDCGHATAAITVDFTRGRLTTIWIRLHPYELRHWNRV